MRIGRPWAQPDRIRVGRSLTRGLVVALFCFWAVVSLFPFYWMLVAATRTTSEMFDIPLPVTPDGAFLANMTAMLAEIPFWRAMFNSFFVAIAGTALGLFFESLAGYAFARMEAPGRTALFGFVLATIMIPAQLGIIPLYLMMGKLHWINDYRALLIPGAVNAFGIFWMRQYALSAVPSELIDAARIDGAHEFTIYWRVAMPLLAPATGTLGILTFLGYWNWFIWPLVVMTNPDMYTLPVALRFLITSFQFDYSKFMAGTALATLPLLVAFAVASRQFMRGLTLGALKG
jgi:cellobiose transport system permease protein